MASSNSIKYVALQDIKKIIDALGELSEGTLCNHSLALIISKTGEATFTSCTWKLLDEIGCSCPLSKLISNAAKSYTSFSGDDCKYFLFVLKEMFSVIYNKVNRSNNVLMRREIINEIYSLKFALPCIFKSIQDLSRSNGNDLDSFSFSKDLNSVVSSFMLSRFSVSDSKVLGSLICDFIQNICETDSLETDSLLTVLAYVISHFDIFCCKKLSPLSESEVIKGFLLYVKHTPSNLNIENVNFIIAWDLTMKAVTEDVAWKINDESFITQLQPFHMDKNIFNYFQSQNIQLIFTPSTCGKDLKLLCKKHNIFLFDRLEMSEVHHLLTCFQIYPLENLKESLETKHIGKLSLVKSLYINKSHFLHLRCVNAVRFLKTHHILLSAPCNAMWKEYYSECLNCFKMIRQWLSPQTNLCFQKRFMNEVPEESEEVSELPTNKGTKDCDICSKIKVKFEDETQKVALVDAVISSHCGVLLPPCSWELIFKTALENVEESLIPCRTVLQAMHLAVAKSICKKVGVPFIAVKDFNTNPSLIKKCNSSEIRCLEPVVCKEVMISNILDLILQLMKIDSIVYVK